MKFIHKIFLFIGLFPFLFLVFIFANSKPVNSQVGCTATLSTNSITQGQNFDVTISNATAGDKFQIWFSSFPGASGNPIGGTISNITIPIGQTSIKVTVDNAAEGLSGFNNTTIYVNTVRTSPSNLLCNSPNNALVIGTVTPSTGTCSFTPTTATITQTTITINASNLVQNAASFYVGPTLVDSLNGLGGGNWQWNGTIPALGASGTPIQPGSYALTVLDTSTNTQVNCGNILLIGVASPSTSPSPLLVPGQNPCQNGVCMTGLGAIPTTVGGFGTMILRIASGLGGGIAFILMVLGAIQVLTSSGDQQKLSAGRERLIAALAGLLFIIFAVLILQFIGLNILGGIPGIQ